MTPVMRHVLVRTPLDDIFSERLTANDWLDLPDLPETIQDAVTSAQPGPVITTVLTLRPQHHRFLVRLYRAFL